MATLIPGLPLPGPLVLQLEALQQAIASGVLEVRFQDRTIRYASVKDLIQASNYLYQLLYGVGAGAGAGMKRQVRTYTNKGL